MNKQKSVSQLDRADFLLDIAKNNVFAKFVYLRRDSHLSPAVLPANIDLQIEYVLKKIFEYGT